LITTMSPMKIQEMTETNPKKLHIFPKQPRSTDSWKFANNFQESQVHGQCRKSQAGHFVKSHCDENQIGNDPECKEPEIFGYFLLRRFLAVWKNTQEAWRACTKKESKNYLSFLP
jgi:hypothetical protein